LLASWLADWLNKSESTGSMAGQHGSEFAIKKSTKKKKKTDFPQQIITKLTMWYL